MSSLVYLADVIAVLALCWWTYNMERTGDAERGLFSMRDGSEAGLKPAPRWRRNADLGGKPEPARAKTPAWRQAPPRDRWRPKA